MITILFFAQLREQLETEKLTVDVISSMSIAALRDYLIEKNPQWITFLSNGNLLFSVNKTLVKASHIVNDGDEVAFFPPVTGG
ncbi:MAG: molybdopterin converting factor subunit 1 [Gammaproteobacteria bacterium]|nr:MAG: molybdopterin converting factor subunit 1 [Gammaproteobacteria bacterium]